MTPSVTTLTAPSSFLSAAISRLEGNALVFFAEADGRSRSVSDWHTLIGRHQMGAVYPDVGRMEPWLNVAGALAQRCVEFLKRVESVTNAEARALETAAKSIRSGGMLCHELALRSEALRPTDNPTFVRLDAMRWAHLHKMTYADIEFPRRDYVSATPNWQETDNEPIRADSSARQVIAQTSQDPLIVGPSWDVFAMAERLAAGIEMDP
jgi:hypothetical protein